MQEDHMVGLRRFQHRMQRYTAFAMAPLSISKPVMVWLAMMSVALLLGLVRLRTYIRDSDFLRNAFSVQIQLVRQDPNLLPRPRQSLQHICHTNLSAFCVGFRVTRFECLDAERLQAFFPKQFCC